jgi:hypothetical protein
MRRRSQREGAQHAQKNSPPGLDDHNTEQLSGGPSKHVPAVEGTAEEKLMARLRDYARGFRRPADKLSQAEKLAYQLFRRRRIDKDKE